ncbi:MAG: class I SAM-dependent methyltransferase [Gammaproteobacteria bacterium]|nr:class I SAM-dependent methyltransferase [Gammaproteobacteria bacterium]
MYTGKYYSDNQHGIDPRRELSYRQEAERLKSRITQGAILDVGCGLGCFLDMLDSRWCKYGVEISDYAIDTCQKRGIIMYRYDAYYCLTPSFFDVVLFRGSIQHIYEPFRAMRQAFDVLKPGGWMVFTATPNADSPCYKLFGDLPALDPPRNWWIPSEATMRQAMINLGMTDIEFVFPYWETNYAQPVGDFTRFALRTMGFEMRKFAFPMNMMECWSRKPA